MSKYTKYKLYQKYETRGSQEAIPVYPNTFSIDGDGTMPVVIVEENSRDCGYTGETQPMYRWYNMPIDKYYVCDECESPTPPTPPTPTGYSDQYLTLVARGSGAFKKYDHSGTFQYSMDEGNTWEGATSATTIYVSNGDRVMFKGTLTPKSSGVGRGVGQFSANTTFEVEGNPMSLLYGDNFSGQTSLSGKNYAFFGLFNYCSGLTSISNLSLPATTLSDYCYYGMFMDCTSLASIPSGLLPATTLAQCCYSSMFGGTAIISIPSGFLPATTLASNCYDMMFENCASLTSVPNNLLPATTLTTRCYQRLFAGCTSLTTVPSNLLPLMTLMEGCYELMFSGCTSLTTAPELLATTLVDYCYEGMFKDCTNLTYVKCLATNISAYWCTQWWVYNVSSSGIFVKNSSMSSWPIGKDGIPSGWTVQNA